MESRVATAFNGNRLERDACARITIPAAPPPVLSSIVSSFPFIAVELWIGSKLDSKVESREGGGIEEEVN